MDTMNTPEDYDAAILILVKGDTVHVKNTDNISLPNFMSILIDVTIALQDAMDASEQALKKIMH